MIDEVMYGEILNANTEKLEKEPPVNALNKLNTSPDWEANQTAKKSRFVPGTGSCDPKRTTTTIARVNNILLRTSLILNADSASAKEKIEALGGSAEVM